MTAHRPLLRASGVEAEAIRRELDGFAPVVRARAPALIRALRAALD
jgi:hypothetical protein